MARASCAHLTQSSGPLYAARRAVEAELGERRPRVAMVPAHPLARAMVIVAEAGDVARAINDDGELAAELIDLALEALSMMRLVRQRRVMPSAVEWAAVADECGRWQDLKASGAFEWCISDDVSDEVRMAVLAEEVGELAEAALTGDVELMMDELTQVAAVALGWLAVAIEKGGS